ncbi:alpha/beta hydrolase [Sphingopyxis macrogoltabida]|uniref:Alpha/beta hydrolase n=1 Tax=Sphingopyxis macrogoltabida TaxID=33050 RepID=A0AAC9AYB6_SPHMC|nr:alpha/beta hydrolase-fold protein [Sphingopyxis macrogoltabida]ALJ15885.1 hypothetical protein LH19_23660 [Sphingopyxis macrogoltabida]AMU92125.1 hypothetical protein ATM17_24220 [Sphingopyxis macrogoltabida]
MVISAIDPCPFVPQRHDQFTVEAAGLGDYAIDVSMPANVPDDARLPVILAVDGNLLFDIVQTVVHGRFASVASPLPPSIVVGVGYPEQEGFASFYARRNFDFHGPWDMTDDLGLRLHEIFGHLKSVEGRGDLRMRAGGYERFLAFLRDDLLPGLAAHYPVDLAARHTLIGDSAGGHFALRALFDAGSPFSRYVAISPSLRTAPGSIERAEAEFASVHGDLAADIFICAGKEEVGTSRDNALCGFGSAVTWCAEQLALRQWPGTRFDCEIMNNEDHVSIAARAISAGLRSVHRVRPGIYRQVTADVAAGSAATPDCDPG